MFVAEIVALLVALAVDMVLAAQTEVPAGLLTTVLAAVVPYAGTAAATLAVLRRRFPRRVGLLGGAVVGLSLLSTAVSALAAHAGAGSVAQPVAAESLAIALVVGAGCRRLRPGPAVVLTVAAGVAVVVAPPVRYGLEEPAALYAAPAALLWGAALAVGLILRDADDRHRAVLEQVRENERLELARELHDLVAHHVSGILVRMQAARALAAGPAGRTQDPAEVYGEVEEAAAEALTAMRRLVGMLRDADHALPAPHASLGDVVRAVATGRVQVDVDHDLEDAPLPPGLLSTVHRVALEAVTNARRHAPAATEIRVSARIDRDDLVLDVVNDGVPARAAGGGGDGYGIIGMTERVSALGGTLHVGAEPEHRWRTTARLPLGSDDTTAADLPRGI